MLLKLNRFSVRPSYLFSLKKGFEPALMPPRIPNQDRINKLMEEGFEEYLFSDNWTALLERDVKKGQMPVDVLNYHKGVENLKKNGFNPS